MSDAITVVDKRHLETTPEPSTNTTPMHLLKIAMDQRADLDKLTKLMDLQERWEKNEARNAYNRAFAAFKSEAIAIVKNVTVNDGPLKGKKHADLFAVVSAVTPALSRHGLSHSWKLTKDESNWLEVTCTLRHEQGHAETVAMGGPPDTGGAKNAIQARASSKTYLERYTLLAITGLAAQDMDTDGNPPPSMDAMELGDWLDAIGQAENLQKLQNLYTDSMKAAKAANDKSAQKAIIDAKDARKRELQ